MLYQQVADADPRNSIAVVGLARVALEREDDRGAYLLARRALAIDPENDAARRLATRLEEVLADARRPVADPMPTAAPTPAPPTRVGGDAVARHAPAPVALRRKSVLDRIRRR